MKHRFVFLGFEDSALSELAARRLDRLMDCAPYDSTVAAMIERIGDGYYTSVDIYSTSGQFAVRTQAANPRESLDRALVRLEEKLESWRAGMHEGDRERRPRRGLHTRARPGARAARHDLGEDSA